MGGSDPFGPARRDRVPSRSHCAVLRPAALDAAPTTRRRRLRGRHAYVHTSRRRLPLRLGRPAHPRRDLVSDGLTGRRRREHAHGPSRNARRASLDPSPMAASTSRVLWRPQRPAHDPPPGVGPVGFAPVSGRCRRGTTRWTMRRRPGQPIATWSDSPSHVTSVRTTINPRRARVRRRDTMAETYVGVAPSRFGHDDRHRRESRAISAITRAVSHDVLADPRRRGELTVDPGEVSRRAL